MLISAKEHLRLAQRYQTRADDPSNQGREADAFRAQRYRLLAQKAAELEAKGVKPKYLTADEAAAKEPHGKRS